VTTISNSAVMRRNLVRGSFAQVTGAPWWFRASCLFMLVGFFMTFVGVLGVAHLAATLRWVGLSLCLLGAAVLPERTRRSGSALAFSGLYLLVCFASALISEFSLLAVAKWTALAMEIALGVCLLPGKLRREDWKWCFDAFAWLMALMLIGCMLGLADPTAYQQQRFRGGLDVNPNTVGLISLITFSLWAWRFTADWERHGWPLRTLLSGTVIVLCLFNLVLTGSRGSATALAAVFAFWVASQARHRGSRAVSLLIVFILAGAAYLSFDLLAPHYGSFVRTRTYGGVLSSRMNRWQQCMNDFRESPYLGVGYGVSSRAKGMEVGVSSIGSITDGGGYFGLLASVGSMGAAAFLSVLIYAYWQGLRLLRRPDAYLPDYVHLYQGAAIVIGLSVNLVGEPWLMGPGNPVQLVFWLAIGALSTIGVLRAEPQDLTTSTNAS